MKKSTLTPPRLGSVPVKPPRLQPKALDAEYFIVPPPASLNVDATPSVVLYDCEGKPLKRPIGFKG